MSYTTLLLEKKENIAILTINRPEVLNALNRQVLEDLASALEALSIDDEANAVIVTGKGEKAFAAGADIAELTQLTSIRAYDFSRKGQLLFEQIENYPKIILAAINGYALGGGCELAMACHLRVASENAVFGQPEVKLGLIAGYGGTQRLPRLIGKTKATEFLLTGESFDAQTALALGLVNYVVKFSELLDKSIELLQKCLRNSRSAISYTLSSINAAYKQPGYEGFVQEAHYFSKAAVSPDGKEGTAAFLEKRKPRFQ
ncbi:MAG: enoyl-CoA hydratase-related protein [Bacteroidia bacterium]|nr:enoyl-CoA hydratase-related protein [Bacteroidia bacterium]MDW8157622.1 enoyl-CoA hydratase-related protein [Bacteroidia bacterium]